MTGPRETLVFDNRNAIRSLEAFPVIAMACVPAVVETYSVSVITSFGLLGAKVICMVSYEPIGNVFEGEPTVYSVPSFSLQTMFDNVSHPVLARMMGRV